MRTPSSPRASSLCLCASIGLAMLIAAAWRSTTAPARCDLRAIDRTVEALDLKECGLQTLDATIGAFTRLKRLDLGRNELRDLPPLPPSLEILFCLGNRFEFVPAAVSALPALRMVSFKSCALREVGVALPRSIRWLILTDNKLEALPSQVAELTRMRKLMLSNNRLRELPALRGFDELELLRLANNRLRRLPAWLLRLPKLTWLALAGNPLFAPPPLAPAALALADFELGPKLGEGTSSVVHRATWRGRTVALKLYKAELSSDGRNIDEVRAASAVDHAHVLKTFGYFTAPQLGAALEFIHGMVALGSPPSLDSVTRDTYPPTAAFGGRFISSVACGIGEALVHVHARRISHGDVYAHNILTGEAKLADFGAAFYYGNSEAAPAFERMEVRAFGLLLRELLVRHNGAEPELLGPVRVAAESAITDATTRPLFAPLVAQLGCARA